MPHPLLKSQLQELVIEHLELEDQPLLVALYYASEAAPNEECLFEVARHFGFDEVSEDRRILQIQFGPSEGFPLPPGDRLRLSLTNVTEFHTALSEGWPEIKDLIRAVNQDKSSLLYYRLGDNDAEEIMSALKIAVPAA